MFDVSPIAIIKTVSSAALKMLWTRRDFVRHVASQALCLIYAKLMRKCTKGRDLLGIYGSNCIDSFYPFIQLFGLTIASVLCMRWLCTSHFQVTYQAPKTIRSKRSYGA
jgi:hypothetical protein